MTSNPRLGPAVFKKNSALIPMVRANLISDRSRSPAMAQIEEDKHYTSWEIGNLQFQQHEALTALSSVDSSTWLISLLLIVELSFILCSVLKIFHIFWSLSTQSRGTLQRAHIFVLRDLWDVWGSLRTGLTNPSIVEYSTVSLLLVLIGN